MDRSPDRAGQVGAGFHLDGNIGCPCDGEAELVAPHTGRLALRIPQDGRDGRRRSESVAPSGRAGQIIGCRIAVQFERTRANGRRCVAPEKDPGQEVAGECGPSDGPDFAWNGNARQRVAVKESGLPDVGDVGANGHTGQIETVEERAILDTRDIVRHGDAGHGGVEIECVAPDHGDRKIANGAGDTDSSTGAGVVGDGDRGSVSVGAVTKLTTHLGRAG